MFLPKTSGPLETGNGSASSPGWAPPHFNPHPRISAVNLKQAMTGGTTASFTNDEPSPEEIQRGSSQIACSTSSPFLESLALDPLEGLPGLGLPGLLALHHSGVAREQPSWPQDRAEVGVVVLQGPGDPEPHSLGLTRGPAAPHKDVKGKEACGRGRGNEGGQQAEAAKSEYLMPVLLFLLKLRVDRNEAGSEWLEGCEWLEGEAVSGWKEGLPCYKGASWDGGGAKRGGGMKLEGGGRGGGLQRGDEITRGRDSLWEPEMLKGSITTSRCMMLRKYSGRERPLMVCGGRGRWICGCVEAAPLIGCCSASSCCCCCGAASSGGGECSQSLTRATAALRFPRPWALPSSSTCGG